MNGTSKAYPIYKVGLVFGLLGSVITFFVWSYATSLVAPPLGIWLFFGGVFPLIIFLVLGYLCPICIDYDEGGVSLKSLLIKRQVPMSKIKRVLFKNVLNDRGKIEFDHPSFLLLETDHRYYRWYFISRFTSDYDGIVRFFCEQQKLSLR